MATAASAVASAAITPWKARPLLPSPFVSYRFTKLRFYRSVANGEKRQLLLCLDAVDKIPGTETFGLDYDTAIEANAIICGNRFDGRLARILSDGSCDHTLVKRPSNGIILSGDYCFCIPQLPQIDDCSVPPVWDYPVVKEFRDWSFPMSIPSRWANSHFEFRPESGACCLTFSTYSTEEAHLIPDAEALWFSENQMASYGGNIGSEANTLTLRADIHRCLDTTRFTFVPKGSNNTVVCHFLVAQNTGGSGELFYNYHDVPISAREKASEFLFARFAYSIFKLPLTVCYIKAGSGKFKILVRGEEKVMTPPEMNAKWGPFAGARPNNSSSKRARTTTPATSAKDGGGDDSDGSDHDAWQPTAMDPTDVQERHRQLDDWLTALPEQQDDDVETPQQPVPSKLSPTLQPRPDAADAAVADTFQVPVMGSIENLQLLPASKRHRPPQPAAEQSRSREAKKEN
jgi:hypothetical protein